MSHLSELFAMNEQLAAFNAGIAPHFAMKPKLPEHITTHDFETTIKGVIFTVEYHSRWDRLDCVWEIVWNSIKVMHADEDMLPLLSPEAVGGLRHWVEADFERLNAESRED